ncbi:MAG TPA: FAD-dependent oxidoreductase [Polyangiaceae bacterium]|jgi:ferredoxin--NADP+ reductase|nr:FAD-dependent oxidoreductase [Polyangiaceae bacterium]
MTAYPLGNQERPLRVAVVGSGPAGFYTAESLVKHKQVVAEVDLFERLPAPYGLVRYGVAPDHQKIKSVTAAYDKLCENPKLRFFGNVHVGQRDVSVEELVAYYDQVVFAVGCETDRHLGIPGEELAGSHPATSFVGWYNGHPDFVDYPVSLDGERALVVGVGDVAMDLTRMLLQPPAELAKTDIDRRALAVFERSRVREVVLLARRGPAQAAFAAKELEDIVEMPGIDVVIDHEHVRADIESGEEHDVLTKRKLEYMATLATRKVGNGDRRMIFRFLTSPVEVVGDGGKVTGLRVEHNELVKDHKGRSSARGTGRLETFDTGLVFRSVGYRGVPIAGLPFDEKQGIVPNLEGRVLRGGEVLPRVYVSGWIKRGPSGVIGTNKSDAAATVQKMVEDLAGLTAPARPKEAIDALLASRGVRVVTLDDWHRIDRIERERGASLGKVRDKLTSLEDVLSALSL